MRFQRLIWVERGWCSCWAQWLPTRIVPSKSSTAITQWWRCHGGIVFQKSNLSILNCVEEKVHVSPFTPQEFEQKTSIALKWRLPCKIATFLSMKQVQRSDGGCIINHTFILDYSYCFGFISYRISLMFRLLGNCIAIQGDKLMYIQWIGFTAKSF